MSHINTIKRILVPLVLLLFAITFGTKVYGQEASTEISSKSTYHNQLFFNRFLINPTFSLVRERKSYINILHRNQYATFEDNDQNYFLGFSNLLNDHTALGISVYSQWSGVVQEFGFNANYASSVKLGANSKLTFGTNITYFNEGLDKNRVVATEDDNKIQESRKESKVAVQPGITLSLGQFDFSLYAKDLLKYNQTTNEFLTNLGTKSVKASVQYTHEFMANRGLFANARLMPLFQIGQNQEGGISYVGSLLLDMPEYGWFQTNFDADYGLSMGLGFNLSKKMSIGYLLEKDLLQDDMDLGWNHEVSLAYTFDDRGTAMGGRSFAENSEDSKIDRIVRNYEEQILRLTAENKKSNKKSKLENTKETTEDRNSLAYENRLILDELILRQDSIEAARDLAFEKRFESLVDVLRQEIKQNMKTQPEEDDSSSPTALASNDKGIEDSGSVEDRTNQIGLASANATHGSSSAAPAAKDIEAVPQGVHTMIASARDKFSNYGRDKEVAAEVESAGIASVDNEEERAKRLEKLPIKVLNQSDIVGVKSGYYVIANVFKTKKYLDAFMTSLEKQGLKAKQFFNKENGLHYVYLADFNYKEDAKTAYVSNLNGRYRDEKWIMQVDDTSAIVSNMYEDQ
ncbi:PorP/SprF family type IX secretion system membrane protein [Pareuzebyella sediminis]|uniref:PorP/SprF family type IX secretion system membrane protein n=1 Tax=Pareuzebyella sediminis TaxID=2607998 RepID=UPI0011EF2117|nr:type IX secretion system membrane protein PorP/SprF [Pareuzebyella sediminis]